MNCSKQELQKEWRNRSSSIATTASSVSVYNPSAAEERVRFDWYQHGVDIILILIAKGGAKPAPEMTSSRLVISYDDEELKAKKEKKAHWLCLCAKRDKNANNASTNEKNPMNASTSGPPVCDECGGSLDDADVAMTSFDDLNTSENANVNNVKTKKVRPLLKITVILSDGVVDLEWRLHDELDPEAGIRFKRKPGSSKIEVTVSKRTPSQWPTLGKPTMQHMSFGLVPDTRTFWKATTRSVAAVTRDTFAVVLQLPPLTHMSPPPGGHVNLRRNVEGKRVKRPYTPVPADMMDEVPATSSTSSSLSFLIKSYPKGRFTSTLASVIPGDIIEVSAGFSGHVFTGVDTLPTGCSRVCLLGAGTGITPLASVIKKILSSGSLAFTIHLVSFQRTRDDVLLESTWTRLSNSHPNQFRHDIVLSEQMEWTGWKGRVCASLVKEIMATAGLHKVVKSQVHFTITTDDDVPNASLKRGDASLKRGESGIGAADAFFFFVCGSTEFNSAAETALEENGVDPRRIHVFA